MDEAGKPVLEQTTDGVLLFYCPGCQQLHGVWVDSPNPKTGAKWTWNGDFFKPTFSPSILVNGVNGSHFRCHSFIRNGVIEYCSDSEHRMAGKSISLAGDPINQL
jgi:hypothetical protein